MSETKYVPKSCAFHPKEFIYNFCKNGECLLPLCPSCVKVHLEEHKAQQTYGQFQNIHKVVDELDGFLQQTIKQLNNCQLEAKEHAKIRTQDQENIKKRIADSKTKMIGIVERFFSDFEKQVSKSIVCYNESMKEHYGDVEYEIQKIKAEIQEKSSSLTTEKVLKTLIGFNAKSEEQRYIEEVQSIKQKLEYLSTQKVEVICQPSASQLVIDELSKYIHLNFLNWEHQIKYVGEFVKTGFSHDSHSNSLTTRT